jgi:hypothetical protein
MSWPIKMRLLSTVLIVLAACPSLAHAAVPDQCAARLPDSLLKLLATRFPSYRLPRVSDYTAEDIGLREKDHPGDHCLGVASVDVDGDGSKDFAFLLADQAGTTRLMAARDVKGGWSVAKLSDFGKNQIGHSYVDTLEPGSYQDLYDSPQAPADYVPEPGRLRRFKSARPGFMAGTIEASGVAYFYTGTRWIHLWLQD